MFLPVGISENDLVGSISFAISFSESLSPDLTWHVARISTMCAWTIMVVSGEGVHVGHGTSLV